MERKRLPYGIPNFRSISEEGYVFIDKTPFLEKLESLGEKYIFFLRPRKFGKSLFVSMLEHYYDINHADKFERLFGDFYIGKLPTSLHNGYLVLLFDFSGINTETKETTFKGFLNNVKSGVKRFIDNHADLLGQTEWNGVLDAESPEIAIRNFLDVVNQRTDKKIYLLIDEYDHFANELLAFKVYVDGVASGQSARPGKIAKTTNPVEFGRWGGGSYFVGIIDEVAIFNAALEESDISSTMTTGLSKLLSGAAVNTKGKIATTWGNIKFE